MRCIGFVSPLGGTGQTTLVANLATLLAQRKLPCLALDLCPQNGLGLHLGLDLPPNEGWLNSVLSDQWWADTAAINTLGVTYLPLGLVNNVDFFTFERQLATEPHWLSDQLADMELGSHEVVLMDSPAWPSALAQQVVDASDLVVICIDASGRSCKLEHSIRSIFESLGAPKKWAVLITAYDPRRQSQRRAVMALRALWADDLVPYTLHQDENLADALTSSTCAAVLSPQAQSVHDMQGIANWLIAQCDINQPHVPSE